MNRVKLWKNILVCGVVLLTVFNVASVFAQATAPDNKLKRIAAGENGIVIIWAENNMWFPTPSSTCSTVVEAVAFDGTTPGGKAMLTIATSAYLAGKTVRVRVSDTECLSVGGLAAKVVQINALN